MVGIEPTPRLGLAIDPPGMADIGDRLNPGRGPTGAGATRGVNAIVAPPPIR